MGCNCASNEQIAKLHSLYGEKLNPTADIALKYKIKKFFNTAGVFVVMFFLSPILFGFVIFKGLSKDKKISLRKVLGLKKRNQQGIDRVVAENILKNIN